MFKTRVQHFSSRRGATLVLAALLTVLMLCVVAFAVDVGLLNLSRAELQRTADAAALAGAARYMSGATAGERIAAVRETAAEYVTLNPVLNSPTTVEMNNYNSPTGDVVVGYINFNDLANCTLELGDPNEFNAVAVTVHRSNAVNGEVPLFFARVMGRKSVNMHAAATAALIRNVSGFRMPTTGERPPVLPIAARVNDWDAVPQNGQDKWSWDPEMERIKPGADGIRELVLFPQGTGSPGNYGTVNIGISANSTSHLANQISHGLSQMDLDFHGGELKLDANGKLNLSGDTGVSAGIKDELAAIAGQLRILPLYNQLSGKGNNATYGIVKWGGVRIMSVTLTGNQRGVVVQPSNVHFKGVVPGEPGGYHSDHVFSQPYLIR